MLELLQNIKLSGPMVRAMLTAKGITDEYIHSLADNLLSGAFSEPEKIGIVEGFAAGLTDGDGAMYAMTDGKEVVTILVTRRPLPTKAVDTGKSP